ncbi:MAG: hypothetical protein AAFX87_15475 [Bacteroidota bacterium]
MKRFILALALCITAGAWQTASAQEYLNSAGLRLGYTSGVTYKRFVNDTQAVEFLLGGRNAGLQLTTTYQFNKPLDLSFTDRVHFYYGIGAHIGYERVFRGTFTNPIIINPPVFGNEFEIERRTEFTMGVDPIVGLEYRWLSIPMTISFDIKPYLDFVGMRYTRTRFWDTAISFKYVF